MKNIDYIWFFIGFSGQFLFTARFIIQWFQSEKAKKSVIPIEFWYLSLAGGMVLLIYAIHRRDPVFIFGQSTGVFIYARNLYLIFQENLRSQQ